MRGSDRLIAYEEIPKNKQRGIAMIDKILGEAVKEDIQHSVWKLCSEVLVSMTKLAATGTLLGSEPKRVSGHTVANIPLEKIAGSMSEHEEIIEHFPAEALELIRAVSKDAGVIVSLTIYDKDEHDEDTLVKLHQILGETVSKTMSAKKGNN